LPPAYEARHRQIIFAKPLGGFWHEGIHKGNPVP
jgi:hypothetical protein